MTTERSGNFLRRGQSIRVILVTQAGNEKEIKGSVVETEPLGLTMNPEYGGEVFIPWTSIAVVWKLNA